MKGKLRAWKEKLQEEANDRQIVYNALTTEDKIKLAQSRRGESKKEVERLSKLEEVAS